MFVMIAIITSDVGITKKLPIEVAVREVFIIAQTIFLGSTNDIGKNRAMARPKSEYFDIDYRNWNLKLKKSKTRFDRDFSLS